MNPTLRQCDRRACVFTQSADFAVAAQAGGAAPACATELESAQAIRFVARPCGVAPRRFRPVSTVCRMHVRARSREAQGLGPPSHQPERGTWMCSLGHFGAGSAPDGALSTHRATPPQHWNIFFSTTLAARSEIHRALLAIQRARPCIGNDAAEDSALFSPTFFQPRGGRLPAAASSAASRDQTMSGCRRTQNRPSRHKLHLRVKRILVWKLLCQSMTLC